MLTCVQGREATLVPRRDHAARHQCRRYHHRRPRYLWRRRQHRGADRRYRRAWRHFDSEDAYQPPGLCGLAICAVRSSGIRRSGARAGGRLTRDMAHNTRYRIARNLTGAAPDNGIFGPTVGTHGARDDRTSTLALGPVHRLRSQCSFGQGTCTCRSYRLHNRKRCAGAGSQCAGQRRSEPTDPSRRLASPRRSLRDPLFRDRRRAGLERSADPCDQQQRNGRQHHRYPFTEAPAARRALV